MRAAMTPNPALVGLVHLFHPLTEHCGYGNCLKPAIRIVSLMRALCESAQFAS